MSTFPRVYKLYTFAWGGVCENQHFFPYTFNFLAWFLFYYFHDYFLHSKNVDVYSFFGGEGEGVSESVRFVHWWKCWHLWMAPKFQTNSLPFPTPINAFRDPFAGASKIKNKNSEPIVYSSSREEASRTWQCHCFMGVETIEFVVFIIT